MSHVHGTYLGGVRSIECLRQRSHVDPDTGCWHFKLCIDAQGPTLHMMIDGERMKVRGRRAAVILKTGKKLPRGHVAFPTRDCPSSDCVAPDHARSAHRKAHGQYLRSLGTQSTPAKTAAAIRTGRTKCAKINMDIARIIRSSEESAKLLSERYGIARQGIVEIRAGKRWRETFAASSVFNWGAAA